MTEGVASLNSTAALYRSEYKRVGTRRTRGELRNEILDAVRRALRAGSYETLSMEHVAAHASISRRTLYNLFVDKDDLYRSSCERLLKSVSDIVTEDVPDKMSPLDGMRFFLACCIEVYESDAARDIILSVVRDGAHQQWLVQAYHRDIHDRLVRACENFILKQTRHSPLPPDVPRYISEQLVGSVKSLTIGPHIFGYVRQPLPPTHERLEVLAKAYAAILLPRSNSATG
ncbi:TetR family transcriptional regulator [Sphingorhabdus profundilacus]|uniref:TetR family transcriptional regulator n=1 Tax=Sphingorhabdus profundilacus TaxID=2509718 RepID=UPI0013651B9B